MTTSFPTIPVDEYPRRWQAVQQLMRQHALDLLIAYADDRAVFGAAHARWLADLPIHFEPACIFLRPEGAPILCSGPESDEYAALRGRIPDVRVLREFTHPDEDYPYSRISGVAELAAEMGSAPAPRVGLAGRSLMSEAFFAALQRALPSAHWVDVESAICDLRAVKSPAEIAVIRRAYAIAELGLQAAVAAIAPGVSERAVAAEAESAMRRAGAEGTGIDTIVASGPNSRPILARSTLRVIQPGDIVLLTVAPRVEGYHAAIGRPVLVGPVPEVVRQARDAAVAAQQASAAALRAGVEGRAAEAIGRAVIAQAGLAEHFLYSGVHSVGVIEFEPPIFGPSSPAVLQTGMVISIDIPLFNAPWGGLRIEDGYLITEAGAEKLNSTPFVLER